MRRIFIVLLIALPAFGKTLHWRSIDIEARLDGNGNLHVVERQQIVFDGDWNGGERKFALRGRQGLQLHGMARVTDGRAVLMRRGDLQDVDQYDLAERDVLRWRSRLESDPPFENRSLTYRIDYTYTNVLESEDGRFVLWHDFGLPERPSVVERLTLKLDFDPVWKTGPVSETRNDLQPGQSVIVRRDMDHAEGLKPRFYWEGQAVLAGFAAGVVLLIALFMRAEKKTGRFARVRPVLHEDLLAVRPEVLGAVWDAEVGPPEVAATLARMAQENKISTRVDGKELHMRLEAPRHELVGYERSLVASLFFDGEETDTKSIRSHYKSSGLDLGQVIRPAIETAVRDLVPGWGAKTKRFRVLPHVITLVVCLLFLGGFGFFGHPEDFGETMVIIVFSALFGLFACLTAYQSSGALTRLTRPFLVPALLMLLPSAALAAGALRAYLNGRMTLIVLIAGSAWLLAILRLVLDILKIRDTPELIAVRKRVVELRGFFIAQLRLPRPAIRDEWYPWLLALGLGKKADRWFRAFGAMGSSGNFASSDSTSGSSSSSSSSWTGGGGAFGGAGATGSWAVAAAAIAGGVADPSSSGGGGGGGGGGSSSGGGGGGGW